MRIRSSSSIALLALAALTVAVGAIPQSARSQPESQPEGESIFSEPAPTLSEYHGPALPEAYPQEEDAEALAEAEEDEPFDEDAEPIVVSLPAGPSEEDEDVEEEGPPETRLEAAERRITELEESVAALEEEIERILDVQEDLLEALVRLEEIGETMEQDRLARDESAAARERRAAALTEIVAELRGVGAALERGNHAGALRPIQVAERRLAGLASEAAGQGRQVEAERIRAAREAALLSMEALGRRDLHDARVALGVAISQLESAARGARTDLPAP